MRFNIKWRAAAIPQLAALLSAVGAGLLAQIRAHQPVGLAQFEVSGGAARSSDLHNSQVHKSCACTACTYTKTAPMREPDATGSMKCEAAS